MTADPWGTPVERARYHVRWTAGSLRTAARKVTANCHTCRYSVHVDELRCHRHEFATEAAACCPDFRKEPTA